MGCNGPDSSKWDGARCVGSSAQTSCSELTQDTCYYAYTDVSGDKSAFFSGRFVPGQGLKISDPGELASLGIGAGDFVNKINGASLTSEAVVEQALAAFTETAPATTISTTHLLGKYQVSLS
jgi:hypothetical protein